MKRFLFFLLIIFTQSCGNNGYHYLNATELGGVTLHPNQNVYKMKLSIRAESNCESEIIVYLNTRPYRFKFESKLDTIIIRDWYQTPVFIKAIMDSCVLENPKIGIQFFGL